MFIIVRNKESPGSNGNTSNFFEFHFLWSKKEEKVEGVEQTQSICTKGEFMLTSYLQWPMSFQGWIMFYMHVNPFFIKDNSE